MVDSNTFSQNGSGSSSSSRSEINIDDAGGAADTSLTGNHNSGNEYGTALPEDARWALVEYLKTL